ncbi:hypothetical protein BaRGS_00025988 [Batillaria attramentaria]|uniref:Uncharacterized protein n=1 Tax=Batillaria attramentaria TaxID=370345 RepID=A0ABD0K7E4_9CAEN
MLKGLVLTVKKDWPLYPSTAMGVVIGLDSERSYRCLLQNASCKTLIRSNLKGVSKKRMGRRKRKKEEERNEKLGCCSRDVYYGELSQTSICEADGWRTQQTDRPAFIKTQPCQHGGLVSEFVNVSAGRTITAAVPDDRRCRAQLPTYDVITVMIELGWRLIT